MEINKSNNKGYTTTIKWYVFKINISGGSVWSVSFFCFFQTVYFILFQFSNFFFSFYNKLNIGYDCGIFTCLFIDFLAMDRPLVFTQEHVTQCRQRIALSILQGKAVGV